MDGKQRNGHKVQRRTSYMRQSVGSQQNNYSGHLSTFSDWLGDPVDRRMTWRYLTFSLAVVRVGFQPMDEPSSRPQDHLGRHPFIRSQTLPSTMSVYVTCSAD